MDNLSTPFDNVITDDISDFAIQVGDRIFISDGVTDIEGVAMFPIAYPYDEQIAIREDDGTELRVKGWQADIIEINGVEYEG